MARSGHAEANDGSGTRQKLWTFGRNAWLLWLWLGLLGCSASYPDGKIICSSDRDCPGGLSCRARADDGELLCFAGASSEQSDSGPGTSSSTAAVGGESGVSRNTVTAGGDAESSTNTGSDGSAGELSGGRGANEAAGSGGDAAVAGSGGMASDRDAEVDAGPRDASDGSTCAAASAECEPGATESQMQPCGACNSGVRPASRSCGDDCRWGPVEPTGMCTDVSAACQPGEEMREARDCECGRTQSRTLTCSDSCTWTAGDWEACDLSGVECRPGDTMPETRGCECGRTQARTTSCSESCTWAAGEWGACDLAGVQCEPGATEMQTVACSTCGTRTQRRSCAADSCTWDGWSDVGSACASACEDCSEVQFCTAPADQPNPGGTKCRQTDGRCTREQTLADCQEDIPVVCGTVREPFYIQYL